MSPTVSRRADSSQGGILPPDTPTTGIPPPITASRLRSFRRSARAGWRSLLMSGSRTIPLSTSGVGMGRALLLAAEMQFREVVGVELNPVLARIAKKNADTWAKAGRVKSPNSSGLSGRDAVRLSCQSLRRFPLQSFQRDGAAPSSSTHLYNFQRSPGRDRPALRQPRI